MLGNRHPIISFSNPIKKNNNPIKNCHNHIKNGDNTIISGKEWLNLFIYSFLAMLTFKFLNFILTYLEMDVLYN